jgi:hypothetical protein
VIGTSRLENVLTVLGSTRAVKDGRGAISAQLIAPSDAGKSELLLQHLPFGARVINDMTFASLLEIIIDPKPPAWIVIPDLNQAISHKPQVANLTMAFLLPLLGEGVTEIPGFDGTPKVKAALRRAKERGLTVGLLTAMTPQMFLGKRGKWRDSGLLRRLVPLYYTYSTETQRRIHSVIRNGHDVLSYRHAVPKRHVKKPVSIALDDAISKDLEKLANDVTEDQLTWRVNGQMTRALEFSFSTHKTFRTYAKAHAMISGRSRVSRGDFDATVDFSKFVRYDRPERL